MAVDLYVIFDSWSGWNNKSFRVQREKESKMLSICAVYIFGVCDDGNVGDACMRTKRVKSGFVTVETAAVLGLYLTITGALVSWGFRLYKASATVLEQSVELESVQDICDKKRQLNLLNEVQKD